MKVLFILRIIHLLALGVAVLSLGMAALGWLQSHPLSGASWRDFANLVGLAVGVILGMVLLWGFVRPKPWSVRANVALHFCWIWIFGWYWFNRFGGSEVRSFDVQQAEVERIQQIVTSVGVFLLWAALCSVLPVFLAARNRGRRESSGHAT